MAFLAVWLERGPKGIAIDGAFSCRHAPRGELRTGAPWQDKKGPRAAVCRFRRSQEFRFETDLRGGFGHCRAELLIEIHILDVARFNRSILSDSMLMRQLRLTSSLRRVRPRTARLE